MLAYKLTKLLRLLANLSIVSEVRKSIKWFHLQTMRKLTKFSKVEIFGTLLMSTELNYSFNLTLILHE